MKIVFVPGNGGCTTQDNWFPAVKLELERAGLRVVAADRRTAYSFQRIKL